MKTRPVFAVAGTAVVMLLALASMIHLIRSQTAIAWSDAADDAQPRISPSVAVRPSATSYTTAVEIGPFVTPETLDPALAYDTASAHILMQIYEPLVTFNGENADELIPQLATDWTISPDARTYTFTIRSGVSFHAGGWLSPHDVAYTFQRGLLQSDVQGPQWLLIQPVMGYDSGDITEEIAGGMYAGDPEGLRANADPAELLATCEKVQAAVVADDEAGIVTFHLARKWSPFLTTLAQWLGGILDSEWAIAQGAWDDDCTTWQNYYSPGAAGSALTPVANGSGPYTLSEWVPDTQVTLDRYAAYWRHTPMWPGGPSGPAAIERVVIKQIADSGTRQQMLLDGEVDFADITGNASQLAGEVLLRYDNPAGLVGTLVHPTGTLRAYDNALVGAATDAFFVYDVQPGGPRNHIGSGALDGEGIPPDFFTDIHVRRAFNYAFDWSSYIATMFDGQGIQRRGPIIKGLMGYADTQPTYFYSPTLALAEMAQAWGGQALSNGFVLTIPYNTGTLIRQTVAETIKEGIEALDPGFRVNLLELSWTDYLSDARGSCLPVYITGWIQDIPHPYNWVQPYLVGTYASRQRLPEDQVSMYQTKIDNCVGLVDETARGCYEDLQTSTYDNATDIFLAQQVDTVWVRAEIRGFFANLGQLNRPYFYALTKGPPPTVAVLTSDADQALDFQNSLGSTATLTVPSGAVTQTQTLAVTTDVIPPESPVAYWLGRLALDIQTYDTQGNLITNRLLPAPMTLTLNYNRETTGPLVEDSLVLLRWIGAGWEDAACGDYIRDLANDQLQVPLCRFGLFALAGTTNDVFLPLVLTD